MGNFETTGLGKNVLTTLMVRNIPVSYTQDMLMQEWPNDDSYDLLYLPYNNKLQRNLTYAFVNFTTEEAARRFKARWQKQRLACFSPRKPLNVSFADVQGHNDNLIQFQKKRVDRIKLRHCQPVVFRHGVRIPFAEALTGVDRRIPRAADEFDH